MKLAPLHEFITSHRSEIPELVLRNVKASAPDDSDDMAIGFAALIDESTRAPQQRAELAVASSLAGTRSAAMWLGARRQARGYGIARIRGYRQGSSVVVDIEDECGGHPPGKPEELFTPLVRKSPDRRGLGLGLTIARRAAEAHSGHTSVTNLPGEGCVFCLALPMKASRGVAQAAL